MTLPDGFARIAMNFTGAGAPTGATVLYCVENTANSSAATIANAAVTMWSSSNMNDMQTSDLTLSSVLVKKGPDSSGASAVVSASLVGTNGAVTATPGLAYLLHKHTAMGGRRGRGRMYVPGLPEGNVDDSGAIASIAISDFNTNLASWLSAHTAATYPVCLEHFPPTSWAIVNGQPRRIPFEGGTVPAPTAVTSMTCDATAATQRRRLRR